MATSSTAKKATPKAPSGKKPVSKPAKSNAKKSALHTFFIDELKDIYWAEKHLVKALPKMRKAAASSELAAAIADHWACRIADAGTRRIIASILRPLSAL